MCLLHQRYVVGLLNASCDYQLKLELLIDIAPSISLQGSESNRGHGSSRNGSVSKRAVVSSSRPSSSVEPSEVLSRTTRLSGSGRPLTAQKTQPGYDKSYIPRTAAARSSRDDPLRSFELLSIGTEKRK